MKLQSIQYLHESTGIVFEVEFKDGKKRITVRTTHGDDEFMFENSKPEILITVATALLEIGNFCAMIRTDEVGVMDVPPADPHSTALLTNYDLRG